MCVKVSFSKCKDNFHAHLQYIAAVGEYKSKISATEKVTPAKSISSPKKIREYLELFQQVLAPNRARGNEKKSARVACKLMISFADNNPKAELRFYKKFMNENFPNHLYTASRHLVLRDYHGEKKWMAHWHVAICVRSFSGSMIDMSPKKTRSLKSSFLRIGAEEKISLGWSSENLSKYKVKPKPVDAQKGRKRRRRTRTNVVTASNNKSL